MTRDNIIFATCGLALGLIIGTLIIGPHVAQSKTSAAMPAEASAAAPADAVGAANNPPNNPMEQVRRQLETLKQTIEREPNNYDALVQLGNLYMDAAKYPQAVGYYERALNVREDPTVRTDLGACYQKTGQLNEALAALEKVIAEAPEQHLARFNAVVVLMDMRRFDEARTQLTKLKELRPGDPDVARLEQALSQAK